MSRVTDAPAHHAPPLESTPGLAGDGPETDAHDVVCDAPPQSEGRNFLWLTLHQVLMRVGWVFKTESIVMPFFMDAIGGGPVMRGSSDGVQPVGFQRAAGALCPVAQADAAEAVGGLRHDDIRHGGARSRCCRSSGRAASGAPSADEAPLPGGCRSSVPGGLRRVLRADGDEPTGESTRSSGKLDAAGAARAAVCGVGDVLGSPIAISRRLGLLMPRWLGVCPTVGSRLVVRRAGVGVLHVASLTHARHPRSEADDHVRGRASPPLGGGSVRTVTRLALAPGPCRPNRRRRRCCSASSVHALSALPGPRDGKRPKRAPPGRSTCGR